MGEESKQEPPKSEDASIATSNPDKPKIDFNVSEEDLAKHKREEEERKAKEATSPDKETTPDKEASSPDKTAPVFAIGGGSDSEDD